MAKRIDQILVINVEATCWQGEPPAGKWRARIIVAEMMHGTLLEFCVIC